MRGLESLTFAHLSPWVCPCYRWHPTLSYFLADTGLLESNQCLIGCHCANTTLSQEQENLSSCLFLIFDTTFLISHFLYSSPYICLVLSSFCSSYILTLTLPQPGIHSTCARTACWETLGPQWLL